MSREKLNKSAGEQILNVRKALKLSQAELARRLGDKGIVISQMGISRYEKGSVRIPADVLIAVKSFIGA